MTMTLDEVVVPCFGQVLGTVLGLIDKAEAHLAQSGKDERALLWLRLAPDMLDLAYQLKSTAVHSWGAIEGVRAGSFSPDTSEAGTLADLRARIEAARDGISALPPGTLEDIADRETWFVAGDFRVPFTVADFLTSFSLPNLHFHATTAYALLRAHGLQVGKRDYLGRMRTGGPV